jgi:hypothetical protein
MKKTMLRKDPTTRFGEGAPMYPKCLDPYSPTIEDISRGEPSVEPERVS